MPTYLVETYLARGDATDRAVREERARLATAEPTRATTGARLEFAIHVPEDETYFLVYEATSADHAALAAQHAGLDPIRVVEAISSGREER